MSDDYVVIEGRVKFTRLKSILFVPIEGPVDVWVPRSLLHAADDMAVEDNELEEIRVREWFAQKEGLI
jgi:hypothetical protein